MDKYFKKKDAKSQQQQQRRNICDDDDAMFYNGIDILACAVFVVFIRSLSLLLQRRT